MATDFEGEFEVERAGDSVRLSGVRLVADLVREVVVGLGLRGDSSMVETEPLAGAYVALDGRLPDFPDHDVALLWNELTGWSAAIEARLGELVEIARLGDDPLPDSAVVVEWVRGLVRREHTGDRSNRDLAAFVPSPRDNDFSQLEPQARHLANLVWLRRNGRDARNEGAGTATDDRCLKHPAQG